jgi:hypothetical protein
MDYSMARPMVLYIVAVAQAADAVSVLARAHRTLKYTTASGLHCACGFGAAVHVAYKQQLCVFCYHQQSAGAHIAAAAAVGSAAAAA